MRRVFYYLFFLLGIFVSNFVSAQYQVQAYRIPSDDYLYNSSTAAGCFVFGLKNNNSSDVVITAVGNAVGPNFTGDLTLWYNSTTVTGAPGPIDATNNWISVKTVAASNATSSTTFVDDLFSGLNITIPGGATYRFAMSGPAYSPYYVAAGNNTANSFLSGGLEILTQDNVASIGYGGAFPSPTFTPRGTAVKITFTPTNACSGTPVAGNAVVSINGKKQSWVCDGNSFLLDLNDNSSATGQTFRWQTSTDDVTWNTYLNAASSSPFLIATQAAATMYYRAEVTCGGDVSYSSSVALSRINSLSGSYTINPVLPTSGTNFQNFDDVAAALKCPINGPVVFNVEPGSTFNLTAPITIPEIPGTSSIKTVTFNGNGSFINYNTPTTSARAALVLDGARYVTIDSFNINVSTGTYGWGIQLTNGADNNVIKKCNITASATSTTSSNTAGIVMTASATSATSGGDNGSGNKIDSNKIVGGYYGITVIGASATPGINNIISNNILQDFYYYGIYSNYQSGLSIKSNDISRPTRSSVASSTTAGSIYLTTGNTGSTVDGNKIHNLFGGTTTSSSYTGIYISSDGTMAEPNRIINNLIYNIEGNGTFYGLSNSGGSYMQAYHNTIALDYTAATAGTTYGFYQTTSVDGIEFINNIVYITRGGTGAKYCIYKSTSATPIVSNYNVLYVNSTGSGTQGIGYQGGAQTTLANWQSTSSQDANSFNVDPLFVSPGSDYTPSEVSINNTGTDVGVATDITGAARSISPDPGAYEFDVVGSDAAITWVSPTLPASMGSNPIKVKISNVATAKITSVNLSYTDGNNQVNEAFAGLNVLAGADTTLEFTAPYNITGNANLRAFINLVNGAPDLNQLNDSTDIQNVCFPLNGAYTINATSPTGGTNFASFADAAAALSCGGVTGPVVIDVVVGTGPYINDRMILPQIAGASATNTVTINGNGETLMYSSNDANERAAILLDGTDHVIIDSLTIDGASGGGSYCWGILLTNQADSNIIRNCDIHVSTTSTTSLYHTSIIMSGSVSAQNTSGNNANYNTITNNQITGGYQGMYLYGLSTAGSQNAGNVITNNTVKDFYQYGIYEYGQSLSTISGNDISRPARTSSTTAAGIYLSTGVTSTTVSNNRVHNMFDGVSTNTSTFYGIYLGSDATTGNDVNVFNNAVYNIAIGNGAHYGIYNSGASYTNIYHNTIVFDDAASTTTSTTRGFYQTTTASNINFKNNIISITRGGSGINTAVYLNTITSSVASDNNSLYSNGTGTNNIGYYDGNYYPAIADWKAANSNAWDQISVSADPMFTSAFTGELIPTDAAINNLGAPVGITTDITGAARSVTAPDPGVYEFDVAGIDAAMAWVSPMSPGTPGLNTITVAVTNTSSSGNITSLKLGYTDGTTLVSQTFPGLSLAPGATQNFAFTTQYDLVRQAQMQAFVELANGTPDISPANDTAFQTLCVPLSGTYSINNVLPSSVTNFASYAEAISALSCTGISGPVVFEVEPGTSHILTDQIIIPSVQGASATNTITFHGNGTSIYYSSPGSTARAAIILNGADHIVFDSLNIDVTGGASYGWGILLTDQADSNVIRKCNIITSNTSTSSVAYAGILISGSTSSATTTGNNGSGNLIDSNKIVGGYYSISAVGATATPGDKNIISNNIIEDYYSNGIYATYQTGLVIKSNDISRPTRTAFSSLASSSAISITTNMTAVSIDGNKIHNLFSGSTASTSTNSGIYITSDGTQADPNLVINNLIYNIEGDGSFYGLYNSGGSYMKAYHNSIALDYTAATAGATYGFYQSTNVDGIEFRNNIVYITRGGSGNKYCIYKSTATTPIVSDHNVLYIVPSVSNPVQAVGYQSAAQISLGDWQSVSGQDGNSVNVDPLFAVPGFDYTPTELSVDDMAVPVGVLTDINGVARSLTNPDPGAIEIPAATGIDIRPELLVAPEVADANCYSSETITIRVKNNSINLLDYSINSLNIKVEVTGPVTATYNTVVNTGNLASGAKEDIDINIPGGVIDMSAPGIYTFKITTTIAGDVNNVNDTITFTRTREALSAGIITVVPTSFCVTGGTPELSSTDLAGYSSITWQQSTTAGTGFTDINDANTNPYKVGTPIAQNLYYRLSATCGASTVYSSEQMVEILNPQLTSTEDSYTCGPGTVTLSATGTGSSINWYANNTDFVPLGSGNTFTTPVINSSTTYYAATSFGGGSAFVGKTSPIASPTSGAGTTNYGLVFDALSDFTLHAVTVYPVHATAGTPGTVTIDVIDGTSGAVLHTATVNVTGYPTSALVAQQVVLDFQIKTGTNYKIRPGARTGVTGLAFDPAASAPGGDWGYPFVLPGVVSINTSTLSSNNAPRNDLYYYFYNWEVTTGCESPRVAVTAIVNDDPGCVSLPVSLLSFNGAKEAEVHVLRWQTTTEVNNSGFELQRSADGISFEKIAFVASKANRGNSNTKIDYVYRDTRPMMGNNFYRLKQIDINGKEVYSGIVLLKQNGKGLFVKRMYPNPVTNNLSVQLETSASDKVTLQVTDIGGKVLIQMNEQIQTGITTIPINVSGLAKGSYFLKVICSSGCETPVSKFVKL